MVDINEQIKKYSEYFKLFNIADGIAYACMHFPDNWKIPQSIGEKVKTGKKDGNIFFFIELNDGTDELFKAVDEVISKNKEREEKIVLFKEKGEELKKLFNDKTIDELKLLKFIIDTPVNSETNKTKSKSKKNKLTKKQSKPIKEEKEQKEIEKNFEEHNIETSEDSNVMSMVKKMVKEG